MDRRGTGLRIFTGRDAPAQAGTGTVVKGGAVSLLVSQFADQLNSAINTLTAKYPISSDYATKVVHPVLPWVTAVMRRCSGIRTEEPGR